MVRWLTLAAFLCWPLHSETLLVLPFANHSGSANLDWIGESIAEALHDVLASENLLVLDREDRLEGYRRLSLHGTTELTHASIIKIGESLDASIVIYGEYRQQPAAEGKDAAKGSLYLTGRFIDMRHMRQSQPFDASGLLEDLPAIEVQLAWQVMKRLNPEWNVSQEDFLRAHPPVRLDAMECYIRGLLASAAEQRHRLFTQAARLDEHFSQPCFRLGMAAWEQKDYKTAASWLQRVTRGNADFYRAQFYLAMCRYYGGDAARAAESFQLVADAVPLNEVFNDLGAAQMRRNDLTAAAASFRKAIEGDDTDPDYHFNLGYTLWRAGDFDGASASLRAAVDRDPNDAEAANLLARAQKQDGPRPGDSRWADRQRIKIDYQEFAYRQLQAELAAKKH